jgi:hypothetical protein
VEPETDPHLHEALLERAEKAVEAAEEIVADSEVLGHLWSDLRETGVTSRCAWCGRYRAGERWVVVERAPTPLAMSTSHSICEDCVTALRRTGMSV